MVPFGLCPWAATAWRSGATRAHVSEAAIFDSAEVAAFADALEDAKHVQIGFFVMPLFVGRPGTWERHAEEARRALRGRAGSPRAWHIAAFHPDLPEAFASPGELVSALRRTPEPLLQLVAEDVLAAVNERGGWSPGVGVSAEPVEPSEPADKDVSATITQKNFATAVSQRMALEAAFARLRVRTAEERASWQEPEGGPRSR